MSENNNIEKDYENFLFGKNKEVPFIVPPHYFNSLEQRIINKIEAAEETSEFSILSNISKEKEFIIPENYFNDVENKIEYAIELSELGELSKIAKPALSELSPEYENSFRDRIINKIEFQEELKEFSTLYALDKQQNFEIHADYFDTVAANVKEKIHSKTNSGVSVLEEIAYFILKPTFRFAFGIVVITGIAAVFYLKNNTAKINDGDCKTLACLEKREMLNEHTIRDMDDDNLYDMVDVDKLDKQITKGASADSSAVNNSKK